MAVIDTVYIATNIFMEEVGVTVDVRYEFHACEMVETKWGMENV